MNYNFGYSLKTPGLVFILCDLSRKMALVKDELEACVKNILTDNINACFSGCSIKNRMRITLIGYGNRTPYIIKEGWADEWVQTLIDTRRNNTPIIIEKLENELECESVWGFCNYLLEKQMADITSNTYYEGLSSPCVINITCRKPQDEQLCSQYINVLKTKRVAGYRPCSSAMVLERIREDFNTAVFNILLLNKYDNHSDVYNPDKKYCSNSKAVSFWKENSSKCDIGYADLLRVQGIDVAKESMMFVATHCSVSVPLICF